MCYNRPIHISVDFNREKNHLEITFNDFEMDRSRAVFISLKNPEDIPFVLASLLQKAVDGDII
jgi:hypothetical protein